ncbi:MAG TPA: sugar ABC transporter ATP-binding protein [Verrucomicrobiae bacterium]|nr:sugar ABC transporter ATP-binding protein [Verrucomicrobiae bacterium]
MPAPLLRLTRISKSFGAIRALREVSFELLPGEVHALVGENGAGKSTLVQVMTGAQQPDSGSVELDGATLTYLTPRRARHLGIACVYQHPALFPDLSIAESIELRLEPIAPFRRVHWQGQRERARRLLKQIGIDIAPGTLVRDLSMPQQQLVEIACALGADARVILLDEPTASLTQREEHLLFAVVRRLRDHGAGVIYVSHRLAEIFALANRVTVLRDGTRICTCNTDKLSEAKLIQLMVGRELSAQTSAPRPIPDHPLLSVRGLGCAACGIADITLEVRRGEIFGLAGLIGAGRTELARTLFGLTPADSGEIALNGQPASVDSPQTAVRHGLAYVPEDRLRHGVIAELSIEQNISLASLSRIFPNGWLHSEAERALALEQVQDLDVRPAAADALVSSLSGGNQQKVALGRWLATEPKVLILDEPTQGVDVGAKSELHKIIRALAERGLGVLLISSDLPELLALSDRIGVMRAGRLVATLPGRSNPHEVMAAAFGQTVVEP